MRKLKAVLAAALVPAIALVLVPAAQASATITGTTADGGFVHQTTGNPNDVYRYGPSIIMNSDGTGDAWFCGPAYDGVWDKIFHKSTTDGGATWGNDAVVLTSTAGSRDAFSVCDPGAFKLGSYYYIGYTSTEDARGTANQVYVARSTSPTGPFTKWNGTGWGGNPQPFVTYNEAAHKYGAGEPSFVVKDGTIYIYYSWIGRDANGVPTNQTRVATASATNANWPGALTYGGIAIDKGQFDGSDSADVKYVDGINKFVAVTAARRFTPSAYLQYWESSDGLTFVPSNVAVGATRPFLHNAGLSGDGSGHLNSAATTNFVSYAFGPQWANWDTYRNPITLTTTSAPAPSHVRTVTPANGAVTVNVTPHPSATSYVLKWGTTSGSYTAQVSSTTPTLTATGLTNGTRYYFAVVTNTAAGASPVSEERSSIPGNFQTIPVVSASASSALTGHAASASVDGDPATFYSSVGHTTRDANESITYDFGAVKYVSRITVSPRTPDPLGNPQFGRGLHLQASNDGSNWFEVPYENALADPFEKPIAARYMRFASETLGADEFNNFYLQLAEVKFETAQWTASSSSTIAGWEPYKVLDSDVAGTGSLFSSNLHASSTGTEYVQVDMGAVRTFRGVTVKPRSGGLGFPVDFSIAVSSNGSTWTTVSGQSYTAYPNPGGNAKSFQFSSAQTARYVRITATKLGGDGTNYALQLADLRPIFSQAAASYSSSVTGGFPATNASDGNEETFFSSASHTTANAQELLAVDLGSSQRVNRVQLVPRPGYSFPSALRIEYSTDNSTWTTVPGMVFEKYFDPAQATTIDNVSARPMFDFRAPVTARYLRFVATQLRPDNNGTYYFQIAEVLVNP